MIETTPDIITELKPNEIFVFGSNLLGRHGKGAALLAKQRFGAIQGQGWGEQGQSFAIPTKDHHLKPLPTKLIAQAIWLFEGWAAANPQKKYLVTKIGCGLAGYTCQEIAPLFWGTDYGLPPNVILPADFWVFQP